MTSRFSPRLDFVQPATDATTTPPASAARRIQKARTLMGTIERIDSRNDLSLRGYCWFCQRTRSRLHSMLAITLKSICLRSVMRLGPMLGVLAIELGLLGGCGPAAPGSTV